MDDSDTHPHQAPWIVAVDIGGSGSRLLAVSATQDQSRITLSGRRVRIRSTGSDAADVVRDLCLRLRATIGHDPVDAAAAGVAGLASLVPDPTGIHATLRTTLGARRTAVAADVVTAHVGALGARPGAVLAVGTGAIALGTDFREVWHRADGWGHLLGDLGSGSWIGARGLRAGLAHHDGRPVGGSALLLRSAEAAFGPVPTWPGQLYTREDRAGVLASFCPAVVAAADEGDRVAKDILVQAGKQLAHTLVAALVPGLPRVASTTGGLLSAGHTLTSALSSEFYRLLPEAELLPPRGTPLDGALGLAQLLSPRSSQHDAPACAGSTTTIRHAPGLLTVDETSLISTTTGESL